MKSHQFFLQICQVRVQFVVQIDLKYFAHSVFDKTKFSKRRHLFSLNLFVFSDEDVFEPVNFVFPDLQFEFEKLDSDFPPPNLVFSLQPLKHCHNPVFLLFLVLLCTTWVDSAFLKKSARKGKAQLPTSSLFFSFSAWSFLSASCLSSSSAISI